jgi:hypothetical protein
MLAYTQQIQAKIRRTPLVREKTRAPLDRHKIEKNICLVMQHFEVTAQACYVTFCSQNNERAFHSGMSEGMNMTTYVVTRCIKSYRGPAA